MIEYPTGFANTFKKAAETLSNGQFSLALTETAYVDFCDSTDALATLPPIETMLEFVMQLHFTDPSVITPAAISEPVPWVGLIFNYEVAPSASKRLRLAIKRSTNHYVASADEDYVPNYRDHFIINLTSSDINWANIASSQPQE